MTSDRGSVGKGSTLLTKSPKITRLFHKRQSLSGSLGKIFDLKSDPNNLSSFDHTPMSADHAPFFNKLYLFPPKEVAMELSLVDSELLRRIRPEELKDAAWTKKATKELLSPNVLSMVRAFNQLALLVPTEILAETTPQARAKVIAAFIRIAMRCRSLHNYNSLKALLAGLQCTPIYRLNRTWRAVPSRRKKQFDQLCALMSEEENWSSYRAKIQRHSLNATPFIPFLGMFLTQVIQMDSFLSIKKPSGSKEEKESQHSKSYTEDTNSQLQESMFDHTHIDPVTLKARRRRSASLCEHSFFPRSSPQREGEETGDDHTPICTADNSMDDHESSTRIDVACSASEIPSPSGHSSACHASSSNEEMLLDEQDFSFIDGVSSDKVTTSSRSSTESESDHAQLTPPTMNGITVPTVEIYAPQVSPSQELKYLRNGKNLARSCETDRGFEIGSRIEDGVVLRRRTKEVLSLEDIPVGFKHRSMSLESLLKAYKENRLSLFKMNSPWGKLKNENNYCSFEVSDDEEEEEGEELDRSGKQESLEEDSLRLNSTCSGLSEVLSELDISCSSLNTSQLQQLQDGEEEEEGQERDVGRNMATLDEFQVDGMQDEESRQLDLSYLSMEDSTDMKSSTPTPVISENTVTDGEKVKRSKSQNSKGTLRRNRAKLRKPKSFADTTAVDAADVTSGSSGDILLRFQTASLGCGMGVVSRDSVRTMLQESVPNSEIENHRLSLEREADS